MMRLMKPIYWAWLVATIILSQWKLLKWCINSGVQTWFLESIHLRNGMLPKYGSKVILAHSLERSTKLRYLLIQSSFLKTILNATLLIAIRIFAKYRELLKINLYMDLKGREYEFRAMEAKYLSWTELLSRAIK